MKKHWKKLKKDRKGLSLIEYALILALVATIVLSALATFGNNAGNPVG